MPTGTSILVVDDDPSLADVTKEMLERELPSCTVATVNSGRKAIGRLRTLAPDCVVVDYDMPETDGVEVLEEIRDHTVPVPAIMYSGTPRSALSANPLSYPLTDYLQKGADSLKRLPDRVAHAVNVQHPTLQQQYVETVFDSVPPVGSRCLWMFNGAMAETVHLTDLSSLTDIDPACVRRDPMNLLEGVAEHDTARLRGAFTKIRQHNPVAVSLRMVRDGQLIPVQVELQPIVVDGGLQRVVGAAARTAHQSLSDEPSVSASSD